MTKYLADVPRKTAECGQNLKDALSTQDKELHPLQDFHQHRLTDDVNPFKLDYRLYAIVVSKQLSLIGLHGRFSRKQGKVLLHLSIF